MTLVIISPCIDVKDGICTTACPVDCIYEGERMFYIHPTECIECGMCETICPVDAIRYDDEVPIEETAFVKLNEEAFLETGGTLASPGGWKKGQPVLPDPDGIGKFKK
ncbi:MAG: ferredoxin family protein [Stappiaceae bacterium]